MEDARHPTVLHVWNTAGVASTLAKWTNKVYGANTNVYDMKKDDPFGHLTYGESYVETGKRFSTLVLQNIRNFDIVHIHGVDDFVYRVKKYYPKKPVVLHYHGTDIRGRWNIKRGHWRYADVILVSTPNLLVGAPREAIYIPNPVDSEFFYPDPNLQGVAPDSALTFRHGADDLARELAEKHDLKLSVRRRNKRFLEMPSLFRQFSWYIDVRRNNAGVVSIGSLTGLEALACGLKVINTDGEIREGLPPQHRAENVVKALRPIYMSLTDYSPFG